MPRLFLLKSLLCAALASLAAPLPVFAAMPARTGEVPTEISAAFRDGRFLVSQARPLGTSAATGTWKLPVILVHFADQPLVHDSAAGWEQALFDTLGSTATGSVFDYYRWASASRLRVVGKVVATVQLDHAKAYYANNAWGLSSSTPQNTYGVVDEALRKCHTQVDWSEYDQDLDGYVDMLWVIHPGIGGEHTVSRQELWSITSRLSSWTGGSAFVTADLVPGSLLKERVDAFSMLPELSAFRPGTRSEIGVFCHEFGHALGLPDLYDTAPWGGVFNVGPGNWSLMSTGAYGTNGASPEFPSHLGAWPLVFLGWSQPTRPTRDTLMTLAPLESGGRILELWFQGESNHEHFLVENRQRLGFDRNLPSEGLIVYLLDDITIRSGLPSNRVIYGPYPGLRVIEADGRQDLIAGANRGEASDPLPGSLGLVRWDDDTRPNTRSIMGNVTQVALQDITPVGDDLRFLARVRAPGWQPARSLTGPGFQPVAGGGPAARAALLDDGGIAWVASELGAGRARVVLRERRPDKTWEPPLSLSQSSGSAIEPSIAALPGGDLCVVWSDSRHGANELYVRSRVQGVWTPERRLSDLAGASRSPSVGADRRGGIHLAWLYNDPSGLRVLFLYFTYLSPFGDPVPVSPAEAIPDPPAVVMAPDRTSYVLWPDRAQSPTSLWFAHFTPDSGLRPSNRLTRPTPGTLPVVNGMVDGAGVLHVAWPISGTSGSELRYLRRSGPEAADTAIVRRGEPIQAFALAADPEGGIHLVMEAAGSGSTQILYKEWRPAGGWDVGNTEVTLPEDGLGASPSMLPRGPGAVTILYTGYPSGSPALLERDRNLWLQPLTGVAENPSGQGPAWRVLPNPLHAGQALRLRGAESHPPGGRIAVFDLEGRLVARGRAVTDTRGWTAEIPASVTRTWPSGIYFARVEGSRARARIVVLR